MALDEITKLREKYVDDLKARGMIKSEVVERAFRRVERHRLLESFFYPDPVQRKFREVNFDPENPELEILKLIYSDTPLVTRMVDGIPISSTSQPGLVAQMLEFLDLKPGQKVLEIGAGTGYTAALIYEIVGKEGHVITMDIQEDVVAQTQRLLRAAGYDRIEVIFGDGFHGYYKNAPYDRIVATVGCPDISLHWVEQLAPEGFMLIPLQHGIEGHNPLTRIWMEQEKILGKFVGPAGFMTAQGELALEQKVSFEVRRKLVKGQPTEEKPLPKPLRDWCNLSITRRSEFFLFASIVDGRAGWAGIFEPAKGACILTEKTVLLYGDAEALYAELVALASSWASFGRPGFEEWELEFVPKGTPLPAKPREYAWIIPRKFTVEIAQLSPKR
ncbi:MAG: methyltransferase domain-containing protein [Candidatus Hadarchaeum sp.]|uniref:methyltransferase domain-containing protein n=1 Tax=Candidatus Hadarchaeum sp. TaxID=2883567 RepID=UPI003D12A529